MNKLLKRIALTGLLASQVAVAMAEEGKASLLGYWKHESKPVILEMTEKDGVMTGEVVKVLLPDDVADPAMAKAKADEALGTKIFRGLRFNEAENAWAGRVYIIKKKEEKDVEVALADPNKLEMTVKIGFIPISQEWNRVEKPVGI